MKTNIDIYVGRGPLNIASENENKHSTSIGRAHTHRYRASEIFSLVLPI